MRRYTILLTLLCSLPIFETTILWRVNVDPPAYLFGTIHLPQPAIWPSLSETAKSAFENSTHFLPEFDVTNFFSSIRMRMCLNSHLSSMPKGMAPPPPPPPLGFANRPQQPAPLLDIFLTMEARRRGKVVDSLETVDIYCEFTKFQMETAMSTPGAGLGPQASSAQPFPNEQTNRDAHHIYNCDLNHPGELLAPTVAHIDDPALLAFKLRLEEIVERRDAQMAQKIDSLLKEASPEKRYFFALGYIHLMSPTGVVAKLRQNFNYSITRLCTDPPQLRAVMMCQGPSWCDPIAGL